MTELQAKFQVSQNEIGILSEQNRLLKVKVLEFSDQNKQNLAEARNKIQKLQLLAKNREEDADLTKAENFQSQKLQRRAFSTLCRNILLCGCARRMREQALHKQNSLGVLIAFLSLKQNRVIQK